MSQQNPPPLSFTSPPPARPHQTTFSLESASQYNQCSRGPSSCYAACSWPSSPRTASLPSQFPLRRRQPRRSKRQEPNHPSPTPNPKFLLTPTSSSCP